MIGVLFIKSCGRAHVTVNLKDQEQPLYARACSACIAAKSPLSRQLFPSLSMPR